MREFLFPDPVYIGQKPSPGRSPANYDARFQRSDWWGDIAPRIRRRAGGCCERCRKKTRCLEVHHLTYERFWCERDEDLQALCRKCHREADRERRKADKKYFSGLGGSTGETEWCEKRWGDDSRAWPDDAGVLFSEWLQRKEEREMMDAVYHVSPRRISRRSQ